MGKEISQITREAMFDLVWTKPVTTIAKELGVSTATVIRECERMRVPRPTSGHWTKLEHGKAPARPALPSLVESVPHNATSTDTRKKPRTEAVVPPFGSTPAVVEDSAIDWHPMVKMTKTAFRSTGSDPRTDVIYPKGDAPHIWIGVTKLHLDRALLILNQLAWQLEKNGFVFEMPEKGKSQIRLVYASTKTEVAFLIREETERYERELRADEKKAEYVWNRWKQRSTGKLKLLINEYHPQGARKSWGDGKHAKLEDKISDAVTSFVICAQGKHAKEMEWQEQRRRWDEEAKKRREEEEKQKREQERRDVISAGADRWTKAKQLMDFRAACEARLRSVMPEGELSAGQRDWLTWFDAVIKDTDPLQSGFLARLERGSEAH